MHRMILRSITIYFFNPQLKVFTESCTHHFYLICIEAACGSLCSSLSIISVSQLFLDHNPPQHLEDCDVPLSPTHPHPHHTSKVVTQEVQTRLQMMELISVLLS